MDTSNLSFCEIARKFPNERILVKPLAWTTRHLSLMRCDFLDTTLPEQPPTQPEPSHATPRTNTDEAPKPAAENFVRPRFTRIDTRLMAMALEHHEYVRSKDYVIFRFAMSKTLLACSTWVRPSVPSEGLPHFPVILIDFDRSVTTPRKVRNWSYDDYVRTKSDGNPYQHPCIAGFVIALGQKVRIHHLLTNTFDPDASYKVQVMLSDKEDLENLHIYSANVPNAFLKKFAYPAERPSAPDAARLTIQHHTLPYEPLESFHLRITDALDRSPQPEPVGS